MIDIKSETVSRVASYLIKQPYEDVALLMAKLQNNGMTAELLQSILDFLVQRPWREVNSLIMDIISQVNAAQAEKGGDGEGK